MGKRWLVLFLIILASALAAWAGATQSQSRKYSQKVDSSRSSCSPLTHAKIAEELTVHARSQPITYSFRETVTVPTSNPHARTLASNFDQKSVKLAQRCLFTNSDIFLNAPKLVSAAHGAVTFTDNTQYTQTPVLNEWTYTLHPREIRFSFSPDAVCGSARPNWTGTDLTLTAITDAAPIHLTPPPYSFHKRSYSWHSPRVSCKVLPKITLAIPTSLVGYLSSRLNTLALPGPFTWT